MWGKEGTSKELPAGLAFCQYCRTIETEAAPQRFLSWRTKGTSSQNPGSAPESALSKTPSAEVRVHANSSRPAIWNESTEGSRLRTGAAASAAEVISAKEAKVLELPTGSGRTG